MALAAPIALSPSKVAAFTECALAFRFSVIDHIPEPPSVAATRGTLVHAGLERLFALPPAERTLAAGIAAVGAALEHLRSDPEFVGLALDDDAERDFVAHAEALVANYFRLEDPRRVHPIGLELMLEATVGSVRLRGIIDRLELGPDGELVVTDYKTGRAPAERYERGRLDGVHLYSALCEHLFGRRPARVQLLYLADPLAITCVPSERTTEATERRLAAVWTAIERACVREDFRPKPSRLCDHCGYKAFCPAFGGNPAAATDAAA